VMLHSLVDRCQHLRGICCSSLQGGSGGEVYSEDGGKTKQNVVTHIPNYEGSPRKHCNKLFSLFASLLTYAMALVCKQTTSIPTKPTDLSAKLVPTSADRGCQVISVTDPYGSILGFLDRTCCVNPVDDTHYDPIHSYKALEQNTSLEHSYEVRCITLLTESLAT
jgi:hypothetical protein